MSKRLILSVDDDEINQMVITSFLEGAGFHVVSLLNGEDCLNYLSAAYAADGDPECSSAMPDAILLDVVMPGMDGFEVCRTIRERFSVTLPVILLSARMSKDDVLHGLRHGLANDYLTKPFDRAVLLAKLEARIAIKDIMIEQAAQRRRTFVSNIYRRLVDVSSGTAAILIVLGQNQNLDSIIGNLSHSLPDSGVVCLELQLNLCMLVSDSPDVLLEFCCLVFGSVSGPASVIQSALCFVTNNTSVSNLLYQALGSGIGRSVVATRDFHSRLSDESLRKFFSNQQIISPRRPVSIKLVPPIDALLSYVRDNRPFPIDPEIISHASSSIRRIDETLKMSPSDHPKLTSLERINCTQFLNQLSPGNLKTSLDNFFEEFIQLRSSLSEIDSGVNFEKINLDVLRKRHQRALEYKSDLASQLGLIDDLQSNFIPID